jgi:hypothetical protein
MRLVVWIESEGVLELNWTWLPTFIGMNSPLKKRIEEQIIPIAVGQSLSEELLQAVDEAIILFLVEEFKIEGLREYLCAIQAVKDARD